MHLLTQCEKLRRSVLAGSRTPKNIESEYYDTVSSQEHVWLPTEESNLEPTVPETVATANCASGEYKTEDSSRCLTVCVTPLAWDEKFAYECE